MKKLQTILLISFLLSSNLIFSQNQSDNSIYLIPFKVLENETSLHQNSQFLNILEKSLTKRQNDFVSVVDSVFVSQTFSAEKYYYDYDENGNLISDLYLVYLNEEWRYNSRNTYEYNELNKLIRSTFEVYDDGWTNDSRFSLTYNENGEISSLLYESWRGTTWGNAFKWTYFYETKSKIDYVLIEAWIGNEWVNNAKLIFSYDSLARVTEILYLSFVSGEWNNRWKQSYEYNENNKIVASKLEVWQDSVWVNASLTNNEYDEFGRLNRVTDKTWENDNWTNIAKREFEYNEQGNISTITKQNWAETDWVNDERSEYNYDASGNMNYATGYVWENSQWSNGDAMFEFYDASGKPFYFYGETLQVYYGVINDVEENEIASQFELYQNYPNPFNPVTTISYVIPNVETQDFASLQNVTLKIYDALGREVATLVNANQTPGEYSVQFEAEELPSGIYFYTLRAGNFIQTRKMVLMK